MILNTIVSLIPLVLAAPTTISTPPVCAVGFDSPVINLTPNGWNLPPITYGNNKSCQIFFGLPKGYFAYVEMSATNLRKGEAMSIEEDMEKADGVGMEINDNGTHNFSNAESWSSDFNVFFNTNGKSTAQFSLNITVLKATPKANIVKSYITFPGCASVFVDTNSWNDGESYKFRSKNDRVAINVASLYTASHYDIHQWNNVFIYERDMLMGTLAQAAFLNVAYVSDTNEVILYMTKRINATGAAMVTDNINVEKVAPSAVYLSNTTASFTQHLNVGYKEASLTLVSSRETPRNVTILAYTKTEPEAILSYNGGGPVEKHSNAVNLATAQLPMTLTGYANTFYLTEGEGSVILM